MLSGMTASLERPERSASSRDNGPRIPIMPIDFGGEDSQNTYQAIPFLMWYFSHHKAVLHQYTKFKIIALHRYP